MLFFDDSIMKITGYTVLILFTCLSCVNFDQNEAFKNTLISFSAPWTSPFRVDTVYKHLLKNKEGSYLYILNKTAWAYFLCDYPEKVLEKAKKQGVNIVRVCMEGTPYIDDLGLDLWPWGGSCEKPD
jgi:hypothetical protein